MWARTSGQSVATIMGALLEVPSAPQLATLVKSNVADTFGKAVGAMSEALATTL